ncbi:DMT family transporter [Helicobacter muridarum]|uniref:DMT family transporter n=1 Tax=Helicobacter muridarum TaxID=216 RepID=A0A099U201_9HELI|nr:DMT family transporter [Helicobacter muridarum]TLE00964.1 DMT family transporter [Helicobacter muridarum]STQ86753.1 Probable amino-acid metabolite efflux pump [Helicobacter muridarum]
MDKDLLFGHILAFGSVFFWSSLYVSVKVLLDYLGPLELLVLQFVIGYFLLLIYKPKIVILQFKTEIWFFLCGLCGITIYNLFLNLAMNHTYASNVSIIIATAPLFTGIFSFIIGIEKPYRNFFIGFVLSIIGVYLLSFNGAIHISPYGDMLALVSAIGWGLYAVLVVKIMQVDIHIVLATRKVIFYGIVCMLPSFLFLSFDINVENLMRPDVIANLLFVAVFASGICFIMWNKATKLIGAIRTNIYVYLTPLITIAVSMIVLDERLSILGYLGAFLTLCGVVISEYKRSEK